MSLRQSKSENLLHPEWIFGAGIFIIGFLTIRILDFNGLYGQDAHEYHRYATEIGDFLSGGPAPGPFFWPLGFPWMGALLGKLLGSNALGLQVISLLGLSLLVPASSKVIRELHPETSKMNAAIYSFLFIALAPFLIRNGVLAMSDTIATAFCIFAIGFCLEYNRKPQLKSFLWVAIFTGLAGITRFNSAFILLFPGILLFITAIKHRRWLDLLMGALCLGIILTPEIFFHIRPEGAFSSSDFLGELSPGNWISTTFDSAQGTLKYRFPNIIFALWPFFHPGFFFAGILLIPVFFLKQYWKDRPQLLWIGGTVLFYQLLMAALPVQGDRLFLQIFPLIPAIFYPSWQFLSQKVSAKWVGMAVLLFVFILQIGMGIYSSRKVWNMNRMERFWVEELNQYPTSRVFTFGLGPALTSYQVKPKVISMWYEPIEDARAGDLLLFNLPAYGQQFNGFMPMQNWDSLNQEFTLDTLTTHPDGWVLYELK